MIAITRDVSVAIADAELTHLSRAPIDFVRAQAQHHAYREVLRALGCTVVELPADPAHPDCVFIEDTAVVLDDVAIITRPGALSRRGEVPVVERALHDYRRTARIEAPATLDGGDVLVTARKIYVGQSERTNAEGVEQLRMLSGREVVAAPVHGALHLKTAVTQVGADLLLINRDWVDADVFSGWRLLDVDPSEPFAANAMRVDETVVYPAAFPRTLARLLAAGVTARTVDADELAKAEGGVTCCALLLS